MKTRTLAVLHPRKCAKKRRQPSEQGSHGRERLSTWLETDDQHHANAVSRPQRRSSLWALRVTHQRAVVALAGAPVSTHILFSLVRTTVDTRRNPLHRTSRSCPTCRLTPTETPPGVSFAAKAGKSAAVLTFSKGKGIRAGVGRPISLAPAIMCAGPLLPSR